MLPTDLAELTGRVVGMIDCHAPAGTGCFSVWLFQDDSLLLLIEDCFYYCVMKDAAVSNYTNVTGICQREVLDSIREFTVGDTNPLDPVHIDLLLVFTGKATLNGVESQTGVSASGNQPVAVNLFTHWLNAGAGHAWARRHRPVHVDLQLPHWR